MISRTTSDFWAGFDALPARVQRQAKVKFRLWRRDPNHPSLHFKELRRDLWSVRVSRQYRALAWREGD